jgi:hypothetical protein
MGSYKHPQVFGPLDLEVIDRVYDAAWAELEAREPFRDRERDEERRDELRKLIMDSTGTGRVEFRCSLRAGAGEHAAEAVVLHAPTRALVAGRHAANEL